MLRKWLGAHSPSAHSFQAVAAPERPPVALPGGNNGNGNGNGSGVTSTSLVALGRPAEQSNSLLGSAPASSEAFDENQVIVAVAPGGDWSRFKTYGVLAVRELRSQGTPSRDPPAGHGSAHVIQRPTDSGTHPRAQRTFEIWSFVFKFVLKRLALNLKWTYRGKFSEAAKKERLQRLAVWLREGLLRLGPTFIKIGQQFSTRVDVLSPELIKELEKLQDKVPPFSTKQAMQIIEQQLGGPVESHFEEFEPAPIAAASLGQVHRAKLNGQRVVVKVQRPGLRELFEIDLKNLRVIAQWLQSVDPKTDGAARDWVAIYDECKRVLYEEIDYTNEGINCDTFRRNFEGVPWIKVPKVYWDKSAQRVLCMEYCPGLKISRVDEIEKQGLDRRLLARYVVESYLQQLLRFGFFHADPHPGNIAVDNGYPGGRLVIYDMGMMGNLRPGVRGGLLELFYAVYERDANKCLDALVTMGVLVPTGDLTAVR